MTWFSIKYFFLLLPPLLLAYRLKLKEIIDFHRTVFQEARSTRGSHDIAL
jgi:hypothetical protein